MSAQSSRGSCGASRTGHNTQHRAICAALAGDRLAEASMSGAIIDAGVVERIAHVEPRVWELLRIMGAQVIGEQPPALGWLAPWRPVVKAAVVWAAGRHRNNERAAQVAVDICASHGWDLPIDHARRLIANERRARRTA